MKYLVGGENAFGQLGLGNTSFYNTPKKCVNWPDNVIDIKCGVAHT